MLTQHGGSALLYGLGDVLVTIGLSTGNSHEQMSAPHAAGIYIDACNVNFHIADDGQRLHILQ